MHVQNTKVAVGGRCSRSRILILKLAQNILHKHINFIVVINIPSNFYDACAEEISCVQGNSHKCRASCKLSFIHINIDFCKH